MPLYSTLASHLWVSHALAGLFCCWLNCCRGQIEPVADISMLCHVPVAEQLYHAYPHSQLVSSRVNSLTAETMVYRHVRTSTDTTLGVTNDFLVSALSQMQGHAATS